MTRGSSRDHDVRGARPGRGWAHGLRSAVISRTIQATARRVIWGLGDQAVSSLTNFTVGIFVARSLSAMEFGVFSLAWVTYGVVLNLSRGLATDPLVVRFSRVPTASWRAAVSRSSGTALLIGIVTGTAGLLAGLAIGGSVSPATNAS